MFGDGIAGTRDMQAVDVNGCGANFTWINAVKGVDKNAFDNQGERTDPTLDTVVPTSTNVIGAAHLIAMGHDSSEAKVQHETQYTVAAPLFQM
eukprot:6186085-Pleurochrysis_carterae.AAC.1